MSIHAETLERFYAAVNRNDMDAMAAHFHPDVVRVEPEGFPTSGTYRGIAEAREHMARGRATWAEGACTPERFLGDGDKVVAYVHVHVRLKGSTDWIDARFADGFVFRDGKIAQFITFAARADALEWAGLGDQG